MKKNYGDYSFKELQKMVKNTGQRATGTRVELIEKLENQPVQQVDDVDIRLSKLEDMMSSFIKSMTSPDKEEEPKVDFNKEGHDVEDFYPDDSMERTEEEYFDEDEEEKPKRVEPKVFQADATERVVEKTSTP